MPGPHGMGRGFGRFRWWLDNFSLLLIAEKPRHGYDIATELRRLGFPIFGVAQMGMIYRVLSDLENRGFVVWRWDTSTSPARKVYTITPLGLEYLEQMAFEMEELRDLVDSFLKRYRSITGGNGDEPREGADRVSKG